MGISQNVNDQVIIWGKDSLDIKLLTKLIEKEINLIRKNNGLDSLIISIDLRIGGLRNSTNCANLPGIELKHTEKGDFYEVASCKLEGIVGNKDILSNIAKSFIGGWMMSPSHKKIILTKKLKFMGCGVAVRSKTVKRDIYICDRKNHGNSTLKSVDYNEFYIWASVRFKK